jgi:hypothetical protein
MHIRQTSRVAEQPKSQAWVAQGLSASRVTMWGTFLLPQCINRSHIWQCAWGGLLKQDLFLCIFWQRGWEEMEATAKTKQYGHEELYFSTVQRHSSYVTGQFNAFLNRPLFSSLAIEFVRQTKGFVNEDDYELNCLAQSSVIRF